MRKKLNIVFSFWAALITVAFVAGCGARKGPTLEDIWRVLRSREFVDLTPPFEPGIPHWPGFPDEKTETLFWYNPGVAPGNTEAASKFGLPPFCLEYNPAAAEISGMLPREFT